MVNFGQTDGLLALAVSLGCELLPTLTIVSAELNQLLTALPGIIVLVDEHGEVLYQSPAAVPLSLVRGDRLRSSRLRKFIADVQLARQASSREWDLKRGDERDDFVVHAAPFSDGTLLLTLDDVSEAKRLDAVRRDFVANVSHELKTPVSALSLLAEAVSEAAEDPEAVRHFTSRMKAEAQRLAVLVGDLLDLSLLSHEGLRAIDPIEVDSFILTATDAVAQIAQNRRVQVTTKGDRGVVIYGDREQLVMAIRNLLTNAVGYSPEGGVVTIAVKRVGDFVEISVSDQGEGIPEEALIRIFERFFRVDPGRSRQTGGTGLGLAIVKHVSANHGGDCVAESVVGDGATFTLRLPVFIDPAGLFDDPDDDDEAATAQVTPDEERGRS